VNGRLTGEELRALQRPFKRRYRREPESALITLEAEGMLGEGISCAGVTMRSVATAMDLQVSGTVHAEGDLDWRGTLAVDKDAPAGFTAIRLRFELDSDASDQDLEKLQELTERYCIVFQTLAGSPELSASLHRS
jgi:OsmC-like protein